jgi:putative transposase
LRFAEGIRVNRKAVYRVLKLKGRMVNQRPVTPRPRVEGLISRAQRSDQRWAMDVTHIACGADGGGHLTAVIDCHDREITGFEFALRGRAKEAERALEEACLKRFGTPRPDGSTPVPTNNSERREKSGVLGRVAVVSPACLNSWILSSLCLPGDSVAGRQWN